MKRIVFYIAVLLIYVLLYAAKPSDWALSIFFTLILAFTFVSLASLNIQWNFFTKSINKGPVASLAITFDDGPHPVNTSKILDILEKKNAKASFFLIGEKVKIHSDVVKRIVDEGHAIGVHSFTHSKMHGFFSTNKVEQEIMDAKNAIREVTGKEINLYRPPFGVTNPNIAKALKRTGMQCIGWNIRIFDTMATDASKLLEKAKERVNNGGSILLLHDTCDLAIEILPDLLDYCKNKGIKVLSLDEVV